MIARPSASTRRLASPSGARQAIVRPSSVTTLGSIARAGAAGSQRTGAVSGSSRRRTSESGRRRAPVSSTRRARLSRACACEPAGRRKRREQRELGLRARRWCVGPRRPTSRAEIPAASARTSISRASGARSARHAGGTVGFGEDQRRARGRRARGRRRAGPRRRSNRRRCRRARARPCPPSARAGAARRLARRD